MDYVKNKPVFACCNPNASDECKKVMRFFESIYGKNILTCQHSPSRFTTDFERIKEITGKYPAMIGAEMISIGRGAKPFLNQEGEMEMSVGASEMAIDWVKKHGCLLTLTWHWHSPSHYHRSHSFYKRFTDFDFTKAMQEKGEDYQYLIEDIDAMAEELKKFQKENIPVLWRPMHEGHGAHFWWGLAPEAYVELYNIMFDRFTNLHGLDNLIWVWEAEEPQYYPGNDKVDISGIDNYWDFTFKSGPMAEHYDRISAISEDKKPLAVTEQNTIFDPEQLSKERVPWLYHMLWCKFYDDEKHNTHENVREFYNHPYVLTEETFKEAYAKITLD